MKIDSKNNEQAKFLHEYNEACSSYKHYSGLRFAEFSVFSALLVAIVAASFNYLPQQPSEITALLRFGGLFLTLIFWAMEARAGQLVDHYLNRARAIESLLGLQAHSTRPSKVRFVIQIKFLFVTNLLYCGITLFWLYALIFVK